MILTDRLGRKKLLQNLEIRSVLQLQDQLLPEWLRRPQDNQCLYADQQENIRYCIKYFLLFKSFTMTCTPAFFWFAESSSEGSQGSSVILQFVSGYLRHQFVLLNHLVSHSYIQAVSTSLTTRSYWGSAQTLGGVLNIALKRGELMQKGDFHHERYFPRSSPNCLPHSLDTLLGVRWDLAASPLSHRLVTSLTLR